jgi:hypothetical protein
MLKVNGAEGLAIRLDRSKVPTTSDTSSIKAMKPYTTLAWFL